MWAFYPPVIIYIFILAIRYRSPLLFTAANPGMKVGGLVDENKASNLLAIQAVYPQAVAKTALIQAHQGSMEAMEQLEILELSYPVILKPNNGQRGVGVQIIRDKSQLQNYFNNFSNTEILLQEYIEGLEFGVFYMREPDQAKGGIFSINEKAFPTLEGDGVSTLEQLILEDSRSHYMAKYLLNLHKDGLGDIPEKGEKVKLVEIGSHCRGSVFLEGSQHITPELESRIDQLSKAIPGYYFGRYDLRVPSIEELKAGTSLKIIEANGVSSESANIYDPSYGLFNAYKVLFKQWRAAFRIGAKNRARGHAPASIREVLKNWSQINKG